MPGVSRLKAIPRNASYWCSGEVFAYAAHAPNMRISVHDIRITRLLCDEQFKGLPHQQQAPQRLETENVSVT